MQAAGDALGMFAEIKGIEFREAGISGHVSLPARPILLSNPQACQYRPHRPKLCSMTSLSIFTLHGLLLFIGAELIFSLTPGPTVMLISAYGFKGGFRDALAAISGTQSGNALWYAICVTGLGA